MPLQVRLLKVWRYLKVALTAGGCEPLQIRRSDGLILAQPPLPAVRQCAAPNSDLFKGWCVIEVSERSEINKALINKSGHGDKL